MATFILPINEQFPIPMINQQTKLPYTALLKIEIENLYVNNTATGTGLPVTQQWSQDKKALTFDIRKMDERTDHEYHLKLIAWDYTDGGNPKRLKRENGTNWDEVHTRTFRTGRDPYPIPHEMVAKTLPIRNQRFFLQDEVAKIAGFFPLIAFTEDMASTDPAKGYFRSDQDNVEYEYFFRWQDFNGGAPLTFTLNNLHGAASVNLISAVLPQLQNDTYYSCQLVRRATRYVTLPNGQQIQAGAGAANAGGTLLSEVRTTNLSVAGFENDLTGTHEVNIEIQLDPGQQLDRNEDLIYQWYFKTSRYNTLESKMASTTFTQSNNTSALSNYPTLFVQNPEGFDVFDIYGEWNGGVQVTRPRVDISTEFAKDVKYYNTAYLPPVGAAGGGGSANPMVVRQAPYSHTPNQGMAGLNNYLNHGLIGMANLFQNMQSGTHRWTYTNPQPACNTQTTISNLAFSWNALAAHADYAKYLSNTIAFPLNAKASNYQGALTDAELQGVWGAYLDETAYSPYYSAVTTPGISVASVSVPMQIQYDPAMTTALDNYQFSSWATNHILDASWDLGFSSCLAPPAPQNLSLPVNKYGDLINQHYPAFTRQLDVLNTSYYQMQQHQGAYSIQFQADRGFLQSIKVPGSLRTMTFNY
jgi:hypothetical protein